VALLLRLASLSHIRSTPLSGLAGKHLELYIIQRPDVLTQL
jgi:hypothetical protein